MDDTLISSLPAVFTRWFESRGWQPRAYQLELLGHMRAGHSALLIAPTGAGKTLAGFLPSLTELAARSDPSGRNPAQARKLHTLYISPLKALAVDVARNLEMPVREMALPIAIETRTGDTPPAKRARQISHPPDMLLTTPEQLALLVSHREANSLFGGLKHVVLDELHALTASKRGDLLALGLARLKAIAPEVVMTGLSATVREPEILARYLDFGGKPPVIIKAPPGAMPELLILNSASRLPLAGHSARHALAEIYAAIGAARLTLVFVNTRMQAEFLFHELWRRNDANWPIALHHGSLDAGQRRKVEGAMASGQLKAVICTSTLDLGIDWGDVDLVVNIGAPKGASRLMQRIGRSNHRLDEASRAFLVPANRFEVMECRAALDAVAVAAQDTPEARKGALDVLAQHVLGVACGGGFEVDELFAEVSAAAPYRTLTRPQFDAVVSFVATGGYALKAYERFAKIVRCKDGRWRAAHARTVQQYRMNIGTIVESTTLKVKLGRAKTSANGATLMRGGRVLGEIEEYFAETMLMGDTFLFAGEVLRFEGITGNEVVCSRTIAGTDPKIPSYAGGKFPLSSFLAERVRVMIADPTTWAGIGGGVDVWLQQQQQKSLIPEAGQMLVETFARSNKHYMVAYPFEGRLAHQTLGMLLTRRLERLKLKPLGFVCTDYGLCVWGLGDLSAAIADRKFALDELFSQDMLGDDLEDWLAESALMKRTFRACAVIAGLIERRFPGQEKNGRQVTMSSDLIYDVLRQHEPSHVLLQAARDDAATGLLDIHRLGQLLFRIKGLIVHKALARMSPLSVSVMLEIGREAVNGEAGDELLAEAEALMLGEAML